MKGSQSIDSLIDSLSWSYLLYDNAGLLFPWVNERYDATWYKAVNQR